MASIQERDNAWIEASIEDDMRQARKALQWRLAGYAWAVGLIWLLFFSH